MLPNRKKGYEKAKADYPKYVFVVNETDGFYTENVFKNTGIFMYEEVTRAASYYNEEIIEIYGESNVWTDDENMYVKRGTY